MNVKDEIIRRIQLLDRCQKDTKLRNLEIEMCRRNLLHFCKNWVWTFDPRTHIANLPFTLYDYQEETLTWLTDRYKNNEVGVIEKSRDMGATWLIVVWTLHKWLFETGFTSLFGSKTEGDVDDSSIDSIFGKVRYILYKLPQFLRPDMAMKIGKREADSYLSIVNPANSNEITGDSANQNFGRSGRRSVVFLDEFAFVDQSDKIWAAVSEVSNVIIPISTPNGKGNYFYSLRSKGTVPVLSLHWTRHPHKNKEWYEDKKKTMEPHQVAQELDIDYTSSKAGRVYKRFNKVYHVSNKPIYPNIHFEQFITWDFGISDNMCIILGQIDAEGGVEVYACYDTTDQDIEFFIPLTRGERPANHFWKFLGEPEQRRILTFLRKAFLDHKTGEFINRQFIQYGDFAGTQRGANSRRSVRDRLKEAGIDLKVNSRQDFASRIQAVDNLLKLKEDGDGFRSRLKISPDCERLIDSILNYVWDKDDVNNPNLKPKHDWASHYVSALEFLAINRFSIRPKAKVTVERIR